MCDMRSSVGVLDWLMPFVNRLGFVRWAVSLLVFVAHYTVTLYLVLIDAFWLGSVAKLRSTTAAVLVWCVLRQPVQVAACKLACASTFVRSSICAFPTRSYVAFGSSVCVSCDSSRGAIRPGVCVFLLSAAPRTKTCQAAAGNTKQLVLVVCFVA